MVVRSRSGLDILALAVEAAHHLRPLQNAVCHPVSVATRCGENIQPGLCLCRTHGCRRVVERKLCAVIVNPDTLSLCEQGVRLAEHHAVPTLIQVAVGTVHIPRNGEVAVVVGLVHTVTIIPVVEVVAHVAVCFLIHGNHHILRTLVNGCLVV